MIVAGIPMNPLPLLKRISDKLRNDRLLCFILASFAVAVIMFWLFGALIQGVRWSNLLLLLHPKVAASLGLVVCVLMVAPIALGIVAFSRKRRVLGALAVLAPLVTLPAWGFALLLAYALQWSTISAVTTPNGQTYCFLYTSFLQAQEMALARSTADLGVCRVVRVLGENNGDWPTSWAWMIRPEGSDDKFGRLFVTDSGMIVGIGENDKAYLAYDPASNRFYGHSDVESLSPFLLIGPATKMRHDDIEALLKFEEERKDTSDGPGVIREAALRRALKHRNPGVSQLAGSILAMRAARPSVDSTAD
jgi:hypothetical protein